METSVPGEWSRGWFWKIIPLFGDSLESMCPVDYDRGVVLAAGLWLLLMIFVSSPPPLSGVDYLDQSHDNFYKYHLRSGTGVTECNEQE